MFRNFCAGISEQSMGARNRVGIWLSYRFLKSLRIPSLIPVIVPSKVAYVQLCTCDDTGSSVSDLVL